MTGEMSRRRALATTAGLIAAPAILRAQEARIVRIVQQRGLLYLPVDVMANGGLIAKQAERMGLGRVEARADVINSAAAVNDALLSGFADFGTAGPPPMRGIGRARDVRRLRPHLCAAPALPRRFQLRGGNSAAGRNMRAALLPT
jgi:ABC-type nitrate/sulfonate/bicarbonate transport system substrate-binding protein